MSFEMKGGPCLRPTCGGDHGLYVMGGFVLGMAVTLLLVIIFGYLR